MNRYIADLRIAAAFIFLAAIALGGAGCAKEITDLRKALVENSKPVQSADVFPNAADRGE